MHFAPILHWKALISIIFVGVNKNAKNVREETGNVKNENGVTEKDVKGNAKNKLSGIFITIFLQLSVRPFVYLFICTFIFDSVQKRATKLIVRQKFIRTIRSV